MKKTLLSVIRKIKRSHKNNYKDHGVLFNINFDASTSQKRVLFIYLNYLNFNSNLNSIYHTSVIESSLIIKSLSEMSFVIDVVNCYANPSIVRELIGDCEYDIIFGFGPIFYMACSMFPNAKKILYVTEGEPQFSECRERERGDYYYFRHKETVALRRSGLYYEKPHFDCADALVVLGDTEQFIQYNIKMYSICPTGLINHSFTRDRISVRDDSNVNFLWLGSSGVVHKGLDILVEVFEKNNRNAILHVCGVSPIEKKLIKSIFNGKVIFHEKINIASDGFIKLVSDCDFIISLSCSEAMSTGVLTGMLHGLYPVVLQDSGLNKLKGNCIFMTSFLLDDVENVLSNLCQFSNMDIYAMKLDAFDFSRSKFVPAVFKQDINNVLRDLL